MQERTVELGTQLHVNCSPLVKEMMEALVQELLEAHTEEPGTQNLFN
jgi:hypothetical protein